MYLSVPKYPEAVPSRSTAAVPKSVSLTRLALVTKKLALFRSRSELRGTSRQWDLAHTNNKQTRRTNNGRGVLMQERNCTGNIDSHAQLVTPLRNCELAGDQR